MIKFEKIHYFRRYQVFLMITNYSPKVLLIVLSFFCADVFPNEANNRLSEFEKAQNLVDSIHHYFDKNQEKYEYYTTAFEKIQLKNLIGENFRKIITKRTEFYQRNYEYRRGIPVLLDAISIAENNGDTLSMATFHKMISSLYYYLGNRDSTNYQLDLAYKYFEQLDNKAELGVICIRKARIEYDLGNYEESLISSFKALELNKAAGDQQKMAISYLQLGNTFYYLTNYRDAKKYYELASMLFKNAKYDYGYYEAFSNIGLVEIKQKEFRKGMNKQFEALEFLKKENYAIDAGATYNYLVTAYFELQKYDSCFYYSKLAKEEFLKSSYEIGLCESYLNDAKVFLVKKQLHEALESAQKGYELAVKHGLIELLEEANFSLYKIHKKLNHPTLSFDHLEQYVQLKDSINFNPNALQSDAIKYQLEAEEAQLKQQFAEERAKIYAEEEKKTRNQLELTLIIAVITLLLLFASIYYLIKNRKLNKNLSIQRKRISEELKVKESLLSEIHHRVKNNLQVISSMLGLQNQYITDESLKKIILDCKSRIASMSLIHESLYRKKDYKEALFSSYIEELMPMLVQTYGTDERKVRLVMDVEPIKLSLDDSLPCGLIINEITSNSLKHGFPDGREGTIRIEFKKVANKIVLTIADDGIGLAEGKKFNSDESFGFLLIETLASQLDAEMKINTENGFSYELTWEGKME